MDIQSGINDNDTYFFIILYKVYNVKRPFVVLYKVRYMLVILRNDIRPISSPPVIFQLELCST